MKYQLEIAINANLEQVSTLFQDYDLFKEWQSGFIGYEVMQGIPGQTNYRGKLIFQTAERLIEMDEFVELNEMPNVMINIYQVDDVWNRCINRFYKKEQKVIWMMDVEFRFKTEMNIPESAFQSETLASMKAFKQFVESRESIIKIRDKRE